MNILVDENIPIICVERLREMGHEIADIRGTTEEGIPDEKLWQKAQKDGRLLISTDKGFTRYRDATHHGILIVRLRQPNRLRITERAIEAIRRFRPEEWPGLLVVMRDNAMSSWRASPQ